MGLGDINRRAERLKLGRIAECPQSGSELRRWRKIARLANLQPRSNHAPEGLARDFVELVHARTLLDGAVRSRTSEKLVPQGGFEPPTPSLRTASSSCRGSALRCVSVRESAPQFNRRTGAQNALRVTSCNHPGTTRTAVLQPDWNLSSIEKPKVSGAASSAAGKSPDVPRAHAEVAVPPPIIERTTDARSRSDALIVNNTLPLNAPSKQMRKEDILIVR